MSYISGRLGRLLAGASTIVALSATLTLAPSATAGAEADGPHYQEPAVGQCHSYTLATAQGKSEPSAAIPCSSKHFAKVFLVGQLPATLTWDSTATQIGKAVSAKCSPGYDKALGSTEKVRRMSAYDYFWFEPTADQKSHGARWFRCDVTMWGHNALAPLPINSNPLLRNGLAYKVTGCLYSTKYYYTACGTGTHSYRATGAFALADGPYPGENALRAAIQRRCPGLAGRYWIAWPISRESWVAGNRITVCYTKTTH